MLCAGSMLLLVKSHALAFIWRHCWSVAKLAGINLRKCGSFSYWFDNLSFTTEGRLSAVLIIPSSWGSKWSVIYMPSSIFFLAPLPGRKKISARGVSHAQSFTLLLFCFISFYLHLFIKNTKKLVPLIACIPLLLLLVHHVVP
jgi:hypothetical protein